MILHNFSKFRDITSCVSAHNGSLPAGPCPESPYLVPVRGFSVKGVQGRV
jgi:hypothetical protein